VGDTICHYLGLICNIADVQQLRLFST